MTEPCGCRVPLAEIADVARDATALHMLDVAASLEVAVRLDWAGRASVTLGDAGRLLARHRQLVQAQAAQAAEQAAAEQAAADEAYRLFETGRLAAKREQMQHKAQEMHGNQWWLNSTPAGNA